MALLGKANAVLEIWTRPWGFFSSSRRLGTLDAERQIKEHFGNLWVHSSKEGRVEVDGKHNAAEPVAGFAEPDPQRSLELLPITSRRPPTLSIRLGGGSHKLQLPPEFVRASSNSIPSNAAEAAASLAFQRAKNVWDRLSEFETALADPMRMWIKLQHRWTVHNEIDEPRMDRIVQHARRLTQTIKAIDRAPRRILRRTHRQVPLSRVQEMDRRALTWLIRQPGESIVEQAGNTQRVLAVTREENLDTLENRVVRAYAELASSVASDYCLRNKRKDKTRRYRDVWEYGRHCKRLARDLRLRGVRRAEAGVTPNFVLLENERYRKVWTAWLELLKRELENDDLWHWQGRSWEEFCALAVMVALQKVPGAQLIAASPIVFLEEQNRGAWIEQDNPFGVFHFPEKNLVIEVQYRLKKPTSWRADLAAPIWLKIGKTDDPGDFAKYVAIWPLWDIHGGLCSGEVQEVAKFMPMFQKQQLLSAILIRPTRSDEVDQEKKENIEYEQFSNVITLTLGAVGETLLEGIEYLTLIIDDLAQRSAG